MLLAGLNSQSVYVESSVVVPIRMSFKSIVRKADIIIKHCIAQ